MRVLRSWNAVVAVGAVVLLAACGSSGPARVSAERYMKAVCDAVAPWVKDVDARSASLNFPNSASLADRKNVTKEFLAALAIDSDRALRQIKAAGTPDIKSGAAVSDGIVGAFTQLKEAMSSAVAQAAALPTDSDAGFKKGADALGNNVRTSIDRIDQSGLTNRDLERAAATQSACRSLRG